MKKKYLLDYRPCAWSESTERLSENLDEVLYSL